MNQELHDYKLLGRNIRAQASAICSLYGKLNFAAAGTSRFLHASSSSG